MANCITPVLHTAGIESTVGRMSTTETAGRVRRTPRGEVRAGVLAAAARVFAERGYAASSVEQIAAAAGFSKGAVFSNFASKDDVFFALLDARSAERRALVADGGADAAGLASLVVAANDADDGWLLLLIEFWSHAARDEALCVRFDAHRAPLRVELAAAIAALAEREGRELPRPAEELALATVALTNGLAMERTADGEPATSLLPHVLPLLLGGAAR
jgi:AcrR family transcriptional regulator